MQLQLFFIIEGIKLADVLITALTNGSFHYGDAPMYGEIAYQYERSKYGYNKYEATKKNK